jgi:hypothetical protein
MQLPHSAPARNNVGPNLETEPTQTDEVARHRRVVSIATQALTFFQALLQPMSKHLQEQPGNHDRDH